MNKQIEKELEAVKAMGELALDKANACPDKNKALAAITEFSAFLLKEYIALARLVEKQERVIDILVADLNDGDSHEQNGVG